MEINKENYREVLISYLEKELSPAEEAMVERYIQENGAASREWEMLNLTRLKPDMTVKFPNKQLLFRKEAEDVVAAAPKVIGLRNTIYRFSAIAIAASLLAFAVIMYMNRPANTVADLHPNTKTTPEKQLGSNRAGQTTADNSTSNEGPKANMNPGTIAPETKSTPKGNLPGKTKKDNNKIQNPPVNTPKPTIIIVEHPQPKDEMATLPTTGGKIQGSEEGNEINGQLPQLKINHTVATVAQKQKAETDTEDKSLAENLFDLAKKVSLKKKTINKQTYYALSIETNNVKVNKTFKSLTEQ